MLVGILALALATQGVTLSPEPHPYVAPQSGDAVVLGTVGTQDANEIEAAKLAMEKAKNRDVKAFAKMLVHDHQQSLTNGTNLAKQLQLMRLLPTDSVLTSIHTQRMAKLNVLSGSAFDKAFMQFEVDGHQAALTRDSALAVAGSPQVQPFVWQHLPMHVMHKETAVKWLAAHP
jgi:putative membrane protein